MNPQDNRDFNRRLQELQAELDKKQSLSSIGTLLGQWIGSHVNLSQGESVVNRVVNWYNSLPNSGKVAVVAIAVLVGFSVLHTVLQLVASLISLAIVAGILYLVYRFFVTPQSPQ